MSDYGATPEDKAMFYFPALRPNMDFAGSLYTIQGHRKPRQKAWPCLFTCMSSGLRYGIPREVISDRGTNFVGEGAS